MKVLYQSIWHRVIFIVMAVFFSAAMMIPSSAVPQTFECPVYLYGYNSQTNADLTQINFGTSQSIPQQRYYKIGPMVELQHEKDNSYIIVVTLNTNTTDNARYLSDNLQIAHLASGAVSEIELPGNIYARTTMTQTYETNSLTCVFSYNTSGLEFADTYDRVYFAWLTALQDSVSTIYRISVESATAYAIYDPPGAELEDIVIQLDQIINNQTNIENKITNNHTSIVQALENIISNQETQNENWNQLFNYGSEYNQIDTTLINNLGSAEDQLSNAEDAIQNKSGSLQQSVSSQWNEATTKTRGFVSTVAPATAALTTTITQIVSAMPKEAQLLLTVIPMLLFIGWLIGRIGGG